MSKNNKRFHIHIEANGYEELATELKEAAYILIGLHESTVKWQTEFGSGNKDDMKRWQQKAEDWKNKHKIYLNEDN